MVTARNFSMSGINLGHHNLPTYEMSLKLDDVEIVRYCGGHFENGDRTRHKKWAVKIQHCPELIPDIEKFLPIAIFKMAATIPHKFNIVRFQRHFICG
jgi:phosphoribosylformylglycinamidine (FGAM) synthase-like amidotransferase family enzyme